MSVSLLGMADLIPFEVSSLDGDETGDAGGSLKIVWLSSSSALVHSWFNSGSTFTGVDVAAGVAGGWSSCWWGTSVHSPVEAAASGSGSTTAIFIVVSPGDLLMVSALTLESLSEGFMDSCFLGSNLGEYSGSLGPQALVEESEENGEEVLLADLGLFPWG